MGRTVSGKIAVYRTRLMKSYAKLIESDSQWALVEQACGDDAARAVYRCGFTRHTGERADSLLVVF